MITPKSRKTKVKSSIKVKQFYMFPQFGGPYFDGKIPVRKKVNFMIQKDLLEAMKFFIPEGGRSDFVNEAVQEALKDFGRKKAMEEMEQFRKTAQWKMTDEEIRKAREYGRE